MARLNDLTGKTFGNWLILYRSGSTPNKASIWHCKCNLCGSERDVVGSSLVSGASTKCRSCVPRQTLSKPHRKDRIYHIYSAMKQRCNNPKAKHYDIYGGRGIKVCEEWEKSADTFIQWAFANGYNDSLTIDRIDCNQGYFPDNCRWVSNNVQSANRRTTHLINYKGEQMPLTQACNLAGICKDSVSWRVKKHGMSYQDAFDLMCDTVK